MSRLAPFVLSFATCVMATTAVASSPRDVTHLSVSRRMLPEKAAERIVVNEDHSHPVVVACTTRFAPPARARRIAPTPSRWWQLDGPDARLVARRGGRAIAFREGAAVTSCASIQSGEAALAIWFCARQLMGRPRARASSAGAPHSALEAGRDRVVELALQGATASEALPSGHVLSVVGDVVADDVVRWALKYLPERQEKSVLTPRVELLELRQSAERLSVLEDRGVGLPTVHYGWPVVGSGEQDAAARIAIAILADGDGSRLQADVLRRRAHVRSVRSWYARHAGARIDGLTLRVASHSSIDQARRFVDGALKQLRLVGPSKAEVERARALLLARTLRDFDSRRERARALGWLELVSPGASLASELERFTEVDEAAVRQAAKLFVDTRRTTVEVYPRGWLIDDPELAAYTLHTVEKGETWADVSRRFQVPVDQIARENDLDPRFALVPGEPLWIPPVN